MHAAPTYAYTSLNYNCVCISSNTALGYSSNEMLPFGWLVTDTENNLPASLKGDPHTLVSMEDSRQTPSQ